MSAYVFLLAPIALLLQPHGNAGTVPRLTGEVVPAHAAAGVSEGTASGTERLTRHRRAEDLSGPAVAQWPLRIAYDAFVVPAAAQVRIERQMTIRIAPRTAPLPPAAIMDLPGRSVGPHFIERRMGKCLSILDIAGVQANGRSNLILFMRDQRIISAELERACRARDFYSGFYLADSTDGKLCVERDTLLSRSGANCKLAKLRQLVEVDD